MKIQNKSTITHKSTYTIAITITNTNKSMYAKMTKDENRNEYFRALVLAPFFYCFEALIILRSGPGMLLNKPPLFSEMKH